MVLNFKVHEQTLEAAATNSTPRKFSRDYLKLHFDFSEDWAEYTKTVFLAYPEYAPTGVILGSDGTMDVNDAYLQHDHFLVYVVGIDNEEVCPTNILAVTLSAGAESWTEIIPAPESIPYQQLIALATGAVKYNAAQSLTAAQKAQARVNIGAAATEDDVADKMNRVDPIGVGKLYMTHSGSNATNAKYVALIPDATGLPDVPGVAATDPRIKLHGQSRNVDIISLIDSDGKNELRLFGDNQNNNVYLSGVLSPRDQHPYDAANKQYVDSSINALEDAVERNMQDLENGLADVATSVDYDDLLHRPLLIARYGVTTYDEIETAFFRGYGFVCGYNYATYFGCVDTDHSLTFYTLDNTGRPRLYWIRVNDDDTWDHGSYPVGNAYKSTANVTLDYSSWTETSGVFYQTVNANALRDVGNDEEVLLQACPTPGSVAAWNTYGMQLVSATAGTLTFKSDSQPSQNENVSVIVAIWR